MEERKKYYQRRRKYYHQQWKQWWSRQDRWGEKLEGMGRKGYILARLLPYLGITLVPILSLGMVRNPAFRRAMLILFGVGPLVSLLIAGWTRLRYWRDTLIFILALLFPGVVGIYTTVLFLLQQEYGSRVLFWFLVVWAINTFFLIRQIQREGKRWEIARQMGVFKPYLDEENWTFEARKERDLMIDLMAAEDAFLKREGLQRREREKWEWVTRLEKLHYLVPGIAVWLRRAFGHEEVLIELFVYMFVYMEGILLQWVLLREYMVFAKVREWEKEKGKPILLREVWEEEEQQRQEK